MENMNFVQPRFAAEPVHFVDLIRYHEAFFGQWLELWARALPFGPESIQSSKEVARPGSCTETLSQLRLLS
jgi:hypothetical protein